MYLCLLAFPFLSFLSTIFLGRFIGIFGSCLLSCLALFFSFLLSLFVNYEVIFCNSISTFVIFPWFDYELFVSPWGFYFDAITVLMLFVVTTVSFLVHVYSTNYMSIDPHLGRFMGYLSLFTFFMLLLVSADNFIVMFLGWEGIGLASFLLIGFWHTRIQAGKSAIKAMIVNRIGDVGLALALCAIFLTFKTLDYNITFSLLPCVVDSKFSFLSFDFNRISVISFLLFWGAVGKSAQIGLHVWLPDAMEGPTPVSALIHAATLVTAGVFLIIRCSYFFENSPSILFVVTIMGSLTAFFAASVGLVQNDLKRVIAYSTCSQLGYMVFACGLSQYSIAFFHLANHAFFKALLFLSAGSIIHGLQDEQDLRKMGSIIKIFPVSYVMILIGSLALTGFPFFTGFYSKDLILEIAFSRYDFIGNFAFVLGNLAALFTSFYSFRLLFLTFINYSNSYKTYLQNGHEGDLALLFPLFCLCFGSIFFGFLAKDLFAGLGTMTFNDSIYCNANNGALIDSEFIPAFFKNIPFYCTVLGFVLSLMFINSFGVNKKLIFDLKRSPAYISLHTFLLKKWHFDQIFNEIVVHRIMNFGYKISFELIDKGNIEIVGAKSVSRELNTISTQFSKYHSGLLNHYLFFMISFFLLFLTLISLFYFFGFSQNIFFLLSVVLPYIFLFN